MMHIPIFLASDNNYAPFVATTIASTCDNTKSFCEFYVLDGGISEDNRNKILELKNLYKNFSLEFININTDKYFAGLIETPKITKSMYNRFLIPYLKPEIEKAVYSDVDVILYGDIAELYNENLDGYAIGAVWEDFWEDSENVKRKKYLELSLNHKYFSSGLLLLDCNLWREKDILSSLLAIGKKYVNSLMYPDQDILNKYFDCNYKLLDRKYCFVDVCRKNGNNNDFIIRHYTAPKKPWQISPQINSSFFPDTRRFWYYMKKTSFFDDLYKKCTVKNQNDLLKYRITKILSGR